MDAVARGRRLLLAVAAVGSAGACHVETGPPVGTSTFRPVGSTGAWPDDGGAAVLVSPVKPDFRATMKAMTARSLSRGHADRFDAVVWANEAAGAAWVGDGAMPEGALLVEEAIERTGKGDRAAGLLVMEKREGAWSFVVVDEAWHVVTWTRAAACAACHASAPHDGVFRVEDTSPLPHPPSPPPRKQGGGSMKDEDAGP